MDNLYINIIDDIAVVKINLAAATLRDAQLLWDKMDEDLIFEHPKVIIDLSFCTFIDSTFIGMIVKIFRRVNEKNGQLKLVFPQITDIESFRVVGITKILECFNTLQNAMESFNLGSSIRKIALEEKIFTN